jgi:uroporphyrin-III C-methyltransferase
MSDPQPAPESGAQSAARTAPVGAEWTALAASLAAEKAARSAGPRSPAAPAAAPPAPVPPRGVQRAVFSSSLALVLAFVAVTVAGMLWWQYRQFYVSLYQTDNAAAAALERVRAEQRALQDDLENVSDDVATVRELNAGVTDRVDSLPGRFADLERRLDAVQGGSFEARADLLRSEAEYYLTIASTELQLARDWDNAVTALELADGRLAELGDPRLGTVREAIAGELLALRGVRLPDVEGLVFSLGRLASRADELPLRADPPARFADRAATLDEAEPGVDRLWLAFKRTLLGLVRVERRDAPVEQALSAAERMLARRQLELELQLAQAAALRTQPQAFKASLTTAMDLLQKDFDPETAEVEGALALLRGMRELELEPQRPDIGGSLTLLRSLTVEGR